jgi:hypothetical protein
MPEMAAFLGCDYVNRVRGYGVDKVFKNRLPGFASAVDKRQYLSNLAGVKADERESYADQFIKVTNLFRQAPVLRCRDDEWVLLPLLPLQANDMQHWASMIGFVEVQHPSELLPVDATQYSKAMLFDGCSFLLDDGGPLPSFKDPVYRNTANVSLPTYAEIDFQKIPVSCVQSIALHRFVNARMLSAIAADCPRVEREDAVERVMHQDILPKDKVQKVIDRWQLTTVLKGVDAADWEDENHEVTLTIRSLATINEAEDVVRQFYPYGNEANLITAYKLVDGGNVLARETLRCRLCRDLVDDSPCVLFQCDVVPHMKGGAK